MSDYLEDDEMLVEDIDDDDEEDIDDDDEEDIDDDDEDVEALLDELEDLDEDEATELLESFPELSDEAADWLERRRRRRRRRRGPRARTRRYKGSVPRAKTSKRSYTPSLKGLATKNELKRTVATLDRKIAVNGKGIRTVNARAKTLNSRINSTEKRLSRSIGKLRTADASQQRAIRVNTKRSRKNTEEIDNVRQTSLLMSLLGGGEKEYEVTDMTPEVTYVVDDKGVVTAQQTGEISSIKLKPKGGMDDLLPLMLMSGGLGGKKGGLDPLMLILLMK